MAYRTPLLTLFVVSSVVAVAFAIPRNVEKNVPVEQDSTFLNFDEPFVQGRFPVMEPVAIPEPEVTNSDVGPVPATGSSDSSFREVRLDTKTDVVF